MRYGFILDQDRCIGCHACTVACKEEHQVPVGVFRTWVKYIEKGAFPHTRRHFGVMRCNHCDSAPCITICPTNALYRRADGIVDFDHRRCIGCKSCMQACPYDALYIDPNTNTAAKCNFCAHRVEANMEPACVIVCPTQAIIAGDLDNPASRIHKIVATDKLSVRKPHKGTQPKVYYKGVEGDLLEPTRLSRQHTYAFAGQYDERATTADFDSSLTREVYDVAHPAPWGWKIAAYLWTKSVAAGVMLVAAIYSGGEILETGRRWHSLFRVVTPFIALIALAVTLALLVFDLKRPDRFFYLLTKANFRSWLVIGSYILMAFGGAVMAWLGFGMSSGGVPGLLLLLTVVLAIGSACYSAFLFAQAKGREFWQSSVFVLHLLIQAVAAGAAVLSLVALIDPAYEAEAWGVSSTALLFFALVLHLLAIVGELFMPHASRDLKLAADYLLRGERAGSFWLRVVFAGIFCPLALIILIVLFNPVAIPAAVAADVLTLHGLWWFERLWVEAGQVVPLS